MNNSVIRANEGKNFLLVEGKDDEIVCTQLLKSYKIKVKIPNKNSPSEDIEIVQKEGIENLLKSIESRLLGSQTGKVGVVIDADADITSHWLTLQNILKKCGYTMIPNAPSPEGTVIKEGDKIPIGIWIMPNNQLPGMLENFCSFLIPPDDILWPLTEEIIEKVIELDRRFPKVYQIKAQIHTWLAWQAEPGKPLGQAIKMRFFDHTAPHACQFIKWICNLFEIQSDLSR